MYRQSPTIVQMFKFNQLDVLKILILGFPIYSSLTFIWTCLHREPMSVHKFCFEYFVYIIWRVPSFDFEEFKTHGLQAHFGPDCQS